MSFNFAKALRTDNIANFQYLKNQDLTNLAQNQRGMMVKPSF